MLHFEMRVGWGGKKIYSRFTIHKEVLLLFGSLSSFCISFLYLDGIYLEDDKLEGKANFTSRLGHPLTKVPLWAS